MTALLNTALWHTGICLWYVLVEYSRPMPSFHTEQLETRGACLCDAKARLLYSAPNKGMLMVLALC